MPAQRAYDQFHRDSAPVPEPQTHGSEFFKKTFEQFGLTLGSHSEGLLDRLTQLAEGSKTVEDEMQAIGFADKIFAYLAGSEILSPLSAEIQQQIRAATLVTDVGKTGPHTANEDETAVFIRLYKIDANFNPSTLSLRSFLDTYLKPQVDISVLTYTETVLQKFLAQDKNIETKHGHVTDMSMREFFNLHAGWTFNILRENDVPLEIAVTAANHHMLESVNPDSILDDEDYIGSEMSFRRPVDEREIFVILLDKYQAQLRRGSEKGVITHQKAIRWLRDFISIPRENDSRYLRELKAGKHERVNALFQTCIDDMDNALGGIRVVEMDQQKAA